ncbi:hydroxyacylglutathione hydrolase C-terminal domain-containing protein [Moritella viscosa]
MLEVISIPTFSDNYVWLIKNTENNHCCIVDPGQAEAVLQVMNQQTQANLMFCYAVEPQNIALKKHIEHTAKLRQQGLPTVPNSLKNEKQINVFLRTNEATVRMAMENKLLDILTSEQAVFTALRVWKDHF